MMKKARYILIVAVFALLIFGLGAAQLILPDKAVSDAERRELKQLPEVSAKAVFNREFSDELESYFLDQFPMREGFRKTNALFRFYGLWQLDSKGYWMRDGIIFKTETKTDETQIRYAARLYNSLISTVLADCNVYFSVVPDKSYFTQDTIYPHLDYDRLLDIMKSDVQGAQYIDILDTLDLSKYYRTDTHWLQARLFDTVQKLGNAMGMGEYITPEGEYTPHELSPFYGVYLQQAAMPVKPESLTYLTSPYTDAAKVSCMSSSGVLQESDEGIYTLSKFEGMDGYDVFLGGTQSIIEIQCPNARTDRELYIFRDSFGSSLAPLFTGAYAKITVIDLRYAASSYLGNYVTFKPGSDVLFINSTLVLNTAMIMR